MGLCCSYELDSECWLAELVLRSDTAASFFRDLAQMKIN